MRKILLICLFFLFFLFGLDGEGRIDWYRTQFDTGNLGNCGPSSAAMVISWYTDTSINVKAVRDFIGFPLGKDGDVSFENLQRALTHFGVFSEMQTIKRIGDIDKLLNDGSLVIFLFVPKLIPIGKKGSRYGRNYLNNGSGHYSVIHGKEGKYFIINDPLPNGRDRYYREDFLTRALKTWMVLVVKRRIEWR